MTLDVNKTFAYPSLLVSYTEMEPDYHVYVAMVKLGRGLEAEYQVIFMASSSLENAIFNLRENPNLEAIVHIDLLTNALTDLDSQVTREHRVM